MAHLTVELALLPTDHGGRNSAVYSGYRPQFYYDFEDWDAIHKYSAEPVQPGQSTVAELTLLSPQHHLGRLYPGMAFLVREGARVVGYGRVIEVLESSLLRLNRYLYLFGYETPTQYANSKAGYRWDDEDSAGVFIEAPTEHDALHAGRMLSEQCVRRMFERLRCQDGGPSWLASGFAHWIEHKPLDRFSNAELELLPVVRWNQLLSPDELLQKLGMVDRTDGDSRQPDPADP